MSIADLRYHARALAAATLAGCATVASPNPAQPLLPAAVRADHTLASYVFVSECCGRGSITLYNLGLTGVVERITKGAAYPGVITVDRSGRLYDITGRIYDGAVTEYDRGSVIPSRKIENDDAWAVTTDSENNLYIDSCPTCHEYGFGKSSVDVYKAGTTKLLRAITKGIDEPVSLAVDTNDDLYVLNAHYSHPSVTVYAPGSSKPLRKLTQGLSGPTVVALDPSNNVFVMNGTYGNPSILEYQAASGKLLRTITSGVQSPQAIALDSSATLYVANDSGGVSGRGSISVYPPGASTPSYEIEHGVDYPKSLTVDAQDDLYVGNVGYSSPIDDRRAVCAYAPNTKKPLRCVRGVRRYDSPTSLTSGP